MGIIAVKKVFSPVTTYKEIFLNHHGVGYPLPAPPAPKFSAANIANSLVIDELNVEHFPRTTLTYYSYANKLEVIVTSDFDGLDISCTNEDPIDASIEHLKDPMFSFYVPVIGYTQKTKNTVTLINKRSNKTILPMFVINTDTRLDYYKQDKWRDYHFIDLCMLFGTSNITERKEVDHFNNTREKGVKRRKMPKKEYSRMLDDDIINAYMSVDRKEFVIPVCRISMEKKADMHYASMILDIINAFGRVCLRIDAKREDMSHFESYILPLASHIDKVYVCIESSNKTVEQDRNDIESVYMVHDTFHTILLRENISTSNSADNIDIKMKNKALIHYKNLLDHFELLVYGDYCGFDKDTVVDASSTIIARTARLIYTDADNPDKVFYRRQRATSNTWPEGMDELQTHIAENKPYYIKASHCEACSNIVNHETRFTLADIKENCIIHNATVVADL